MTVENFSRLTEAKLLNKPSISSFENIEIDPKKVRRGDLFISDTKEDIKLAVKNEAYGIASTEICEIIDEEIAWFDIDSVDDVLIRLLRFNLLEKKLHFVHAQEIELELIYKIASKEHLIILNEDEKDNYKKIINADEKSFIFSSNIKLLGQIYPDFRTLPKVKTLKFNTIKSTLFLTHFTYQRLKYKDIKIPPLFLHHLEKIVSFLDENRINYDIKKCDYTTHFYPIFVDQKLQIKPFGKSDHVLICESDKSLIDQKVSYLVKSAPWAKVICFELTEFTNINELKNIEFNFAIINISYEKLITQLEKLDKKEKTVLF